MITVPRVLLLGVLGFGASCATRQDASTRPDDLAPTDSSIDPATGLSTRVIHEPSGVVLVLIPAGEFWMGSPDSQHERRHRRVVRKAFYLGETEVTHAQFRRFAEATGYRTDAETGADEQGMGVGAFAATSDGERDWNAASSWRNPFPNFPDFATRDDHPVVQVSWNDARRFCSHYGLSLPSEAQWEYACRAGAETVFPWGDGAWGGAGRANVRDQAFASKFNSNAEFPFDDHAAMIAPVRTYRPSAWGAYDMIGNVEEWCEDVYSLYPADGSDASPAVGSEGAGRIERGGSWVSGTTPARCAWRGGMMATSRRDFIGFRVAMHAISGGAGASRPTR